MLTFNVLNSVGIKVFMKTDMQKREKYFLFKKIDVTFEKRVPLEDIPSPNNPMFQFFEHDLCTEVLQNLRQSYEPKEGVFVK